jgi:serine/threonine protein kinase
LGENQIGDEGMETLAMALKENTSVTYLDVTTNDISFVGAEALEETFLVNRSLTQIMLQGNDPGVVPPVEPLERNRVLRHHGQALLDRGIGLFVRVVEKHHHQQNHQHNPDNDSQSHHQHSQRYLEWTEELWKGTVLDEPIEWILIHRVLQVLRQVSSGISSSSSPSSNVPPWPLPTGKLLDCLRQQPHVVQHLLDYSTNAHGSNLLHVTVSAQSPVALDLCKFLVSDLGANIDRVKDAQGRSAREIGVHHSGSDKMQEWARCVGYFLHRYQVEGGSLQAAIPVYRTDKGMAHFARDAWKSRTDPTAEVMLFLVDDPVHFSNEVSCRLKVDPTVVPSGVDIPDKAQRFSQEYVVPLIRFHDELDDSGVRHKCLVFPLLERSLQGMIDLERVACCDMEHIRGIVAGVSKAIQHVHQADPLKSIIHCNVEPRNIIRENGTYKLMGFDLAVPEGGFIPANRAITNTCPPEVARWLVHLGSLKELSVAVADLKRQQVQLVETTPGDSKRLLEILKEVQLLRKKIAILELRDGSKHIAPLSDQNRRKQRLSIKSTQRAEQKVASDFDECKSQSSPPRHVEFELEALLPTPGNKQHPGEESAQGSCVGAVGPNERTEGSADETVRLTLDGKPPADDQATSLFTEKSERGEETTSSQISVGIATPPNSKDAAMHLIAHQTFDIWSLGVTLYKLFTGEDLFPTNHDGQIASLKDQIDLAMWHGLDTEQLSKILTRCEDATTIGRNRAKDLVSRCLHPDPSKRPQDIEEVLSHRFLVADEAEDDGQLLVAPLEFSFGIDEAPQTSMPLSFLILPCQLFISEHTGKLVAPAQAKDAIDKFCKMQELAVLQHLLTAKYKENDVETEDLIRECRNLDGKDAAERLLKYMQVSDTSVDYFIERLHDLNEFKNTPSTFMEHRLKEAFQDWWHAQSGRPAYFYLIDEFFFKPVVTTKYPIELGPRSSFLRDLIPLFCLRKTQISVLSACTYVLGRSISLPSRLNDWAVEELTNLNSGPTVADYQIQRQAVNKLGEFDAVDEKTETESLEKFASIEDVFGNVLESFFAEYDPEREFSGLQKVSERDGTSRWTSEDGSVAMERAKATPVTENISRRRQLEEALHEAQETLQRVGATAKRLVEERDALQKEKLLLIRSNKGLEDYIEKEMIAEAAAGCCTIL